MPGTPPQKLWPTWLACLLSLYPAYFLAYFLLFAVPALSRVAVSGYTLSTVSLTYRGVDASSRPAVPTPRARGAGGPSLPIAIGAAILVGLIAIKHPISAGLTLAMLGAVGAPQSLLRMFFMKQWTGLDCVAAIFFFSLICTGLRFLLRALDPETRLRRIGFLYAVFVFPAAIVLVFASLYFFRRQLPWFYLPTLLAPAALAAILTGCWQGRNNSAPKQFITWRPVAVLAAFAILIAIAGKTGAQAFDRGRREIAGAALAALPPVPTQSPYPMSFFQKGVNFTAEFPGGYTSESARQMLRTLPKHGINSIALVPYGYVDRNTGRVRWGGGMESDDGIEQLSRIAHQLNIKVLLKPQVMSRGGYPGDLQFPSPEIRANWFVEYSKMVEHYAQLAKTIHADMFCVGVEFQKLVQYESDWRKIIARARALYNGPLVYAATQGPEFESINFWDQLDYIGLDNYYPLPDDLNTTAIVQKVEAVQKKYQKPVIFTEAGFASFEGSHREPWAETPGKIVLSAQAQCYEAILKAFYHKPWFQGVYWWKIGTDGHGGPDDGSLTPWGKPAMEVVARWYLQQGR